MSTKEVEIGKDEYGWWPCIQTRPNEVYLCSDGKWRSYIRIDQRFPSKEAAEECLKVNPYKGVNDD